MASVLVAMVWAAGAVLMVLALVLPFRRSINQLIDARRNEVNATAEAARAAALERQNAAELERLTMQKQAAAKNAELRLQAAQADTSAQVAAGTVEARISAEKAVIAARTEGRAAAAKEQALTGATATTAGLKMLLAQYDAWQVRTGGQLEFGRWIGDLELHDGGLVHRR